MQAVNGGKPNSLCFMRMMKMVRKSLVSNEFDDQVHLPHRHSNSWGIDCFVAQHFRMA